MKVNAMSMLHRRRRLKENCALEKTTQNDKSAKAAPAVPAAPAAPITTIERLVANLNGRIDIH